MKDKNTVLMAIAGGIFLLAGCLLVFYLIRGPSPHRSTSSSSSAQSYSSTSPDKSGSNAYSGSSQTSSSYGAYSPTTSGGGSSVISPELAREVEEARKVDEQSLERIDKESRDWLERFVNDKSVPLLTRELYRLRNDPRCVDAFSAYNRGDLSAAAELFEKAYLDPTSSPMIKFFSSKYLMSIAQGQERTDDYFKWGKELGTLMAKEDFSFIEEPKSPKFLNDIKRKETYFKAKTDTGLREKIIDDLMKELGPDIKRDWVQKEVEERMKRAEREVLGIVG